MKNRYQVHPCSNPLYTQHPCPATSITQASHHPWCHIPAPWKQRCSGSEWHHLTNRGWEPSPRVPGGILSMETGEVNWAYDIGRIRYIGRCASNRAYDYWLREVEKDCSVWCDIWVVVWLASLGCGGWHDPWLLSVGFMLDWVDRRIFITIWLFLISLSSFTGVMILCKYFLILLVWLEWVEAGPYNMLETMKMTS